MPSLRRSWSRSTVGPPAASISTVVPATAARSPPSRLAARATGHPPRRPAEGWLVSRAAPSSELYQSLSLLLRYPTAELLAADSEIDLIAGSFPTPARDRIRGFVGHRGRTSLIDLEREYVETFDTRRRCTLNVSYYLYGDTRRRGLALLRLRRMYAAAGLIPESE